MKWLCQCSSFFFTKRFKWNWFPEVKRADKSKEVANVCAHALCYVVFKFLCIGWFLPLFSGVKFRSDCLNQLHPFIVRSSTSDASSSSGSVMLTGDTRADADILAFIKARQNLLQQRGLLDYTGKWFVSGGNKRLFRCSGRIKGRLKPICPELNGRDGLQSPCGYLILVHRFQSPRQEKRWVERGEFRCEGNGEWCMTNLEFVFVFFFCL